MESALCEYSYSYSVEINILAHHCRNPGLSIMLKEVALPSDKMGKTPLDDVSCASELFEYIQKGSSNYRRILLIHKPRGTTTYKTRMKKT